MNSDDRPARPSWHDRRFAPRVPRRGGRRVGRRPGRPAAAGVAQAAPPGGTGLHGAELRGMYLTSKNRLAEGRFGAMFKKLPAFAPRDDLLTAWPGRWSSRTPATASSTTSPRLFAGFTFIGQFIDHDITLDTTPLDQQLADPDATVNFRTPRYDLDSVYGRGPAQDPQFYDPADRDKLLLATERQRCPGRPA